LRGEQGPLEAYAAVVELLDHRPAGHGFLFEQLLEAMPVSEERPIGPDDLEFPFLSQIIRPVRRHLFLFLLEAAFCRGGSGSSSGGSSGHH
jgi:hypothetical protein